MTFRFCSCYDCGKAAHRAYLSGLITYRELRDCMSGDLMVAGLSLYTARGQRGPVTLFKGRAAAIDREWPRLKHTPRPSRLRGRRMIGTRP